MGRRQEAEPALFYEFSLAYHVPKDHLLRSIDRFVDLSGIRPYLADFYRHTGRSSGDPELMIRMLLVGYCFGTLRERRLCEEVHLNLAYRWFCRLDIGERVPDQSTLFQETARSVPGPRTVASCTRNDGGAMPRRGHGQRAAYGRRRRPYRS